MADIKQKQNKNTGASASSQGKSGRPEVRDGYLAQQRALGAVLPSPALLESYAEVDPEFIPTLIDMIQKEQKHRHKLAERQIQAQSYSTRIGQLLAFALVVIILYVTVNFAAEGQELLGIIIAIAGFSFLIAINFVPTIVAKIHRSQLMARKNHKHFGLGRFFASDKNSKDAGAGKAASSGSQGRGAGAGRNYRRNKRRGRNTN